MCQKSNKENEAEGRRLEGLKYGKEYLELSPLSIIKVADPMMANSPWKYAVSVKITNRGSQDIWGGTIEYTAPRFWRFTNGDDKDDVGSEKLILIFICECHPGKTFLAGDSFDAWYEGPPNSIPPNLNPDVLSLDSIEAWLEYPK